MFFIYREEVKIIKIVKNVNVKFTDNAFIGWKKLKLDIKFTKSKKAQAAKKKDSLKLSNGKLSHYHAIMNYDIWLRKFMHNELSLYMKESSDNPSGALFGSSFSKRRH